MERERWNADLLDDADGERHDTISDETCWPIPKRARNLRAHVGPSSSTPSSPSCGRGEFCLHMGPMFFLKFLFLLTKMPYRRNQPSYCNRT
jgi:hypothetical protein